FFTPTATPVISTLSLHDALPICATASAVSRPDAVICSATFCGQETSTPAISNGLANSAQSEATKQTTGWTGTSAASGSGASAPLDRKSTRLNSSHVKISYAVFCL